MKKLFLMLSLSLFFFASCSKAPEQPRQYQVLGSTPITNVALFENRSKIMVSWLEKDYKNMTLVHIDAHDALAFLPEENIKNIKKLVRDKNWKELERSFMPDSYLYSAIRLGIARKIFWVIPNRFLEYYDAERRVKFFLKNLPSGFKVEEINKFKFNRGCVSGKLHDAEISICSAETLPFIPEAVVFDIDADFFPPYSLEKGISNLRGLKEFFDAMNQRQLKIASAEISFSEGRESLNPVHRYIGMQLSEALKDPEILKATVPHELWSIRNNAESMISSGAFKEALEYLNKSMEKYPEEQSLIMFRAVALAHTGKTEAALDSLERLCKRDKNLCYGIIYAGRELEKIGKINASRLFFEKAIELRPDLAAMVQVD